MARTPGHGLALGLALAALVAAGAQADTPAITVVAQGQASAAPDMAMLRLGVRERADTAEAALEATSQATAALMAALEGAGVAARDIQTSDLSLQPLWHSDSGREEATLRGFEAANAVTVRIRDLDGLGPLLTAAVAQGANRFDGLSFGLEDSADIMDLARRRAVGDALRKGAVLAQAAGVDLPPLRSISEEGGQMPRTLSMRGAEMDMAGGVPVAAGEVTVSVHVTVVFGGSD